MNIRRAIHGLGVLLEEAQKKISVNDLDGAKKFLLEAKEWLNNIIRKFNEQTQKKINEEKGNQKDQQENQQAG